MADAGATGHFILSGVLVTDIGPATNPFVINLTDDKKMKSACTRKLKLPWLPDKARETHIVPGLAHTLLLSTKVLCNAGCTVTYANQLCKVLYRNKIFWQGQCQPINGLWVL